MLDGDADSNMEELICDLRSMPWQWNPSQCAIEMAFGTFVGGGVAHIKIDGDARDALAHVEGSIKSIKSLRGKTESGGIYLHVIFVPCRDSECTPFAYE